MLVILMVLDVGGSNIVWQWCARHLIALITFAVTRCHHHKQISTNLLLVLLQLFTSHRRCGCSEEGRDLRRKKKKGVFTTDSCGVHQFLRSHISYDSCSATISVAAITNNCTSLLLSTGSEGFCLAPKSMTLLFI